MKKEAFSSSFLCVIDSRIDSYCADFSRDCSYDNLLSFGACGTTKTFPLCYFHLYNFVASTLVFFIYIFVLTHITRMG